MAKTLDRARDTLESQRRGRNAALRSELDDLQMATAALREMMECQTSLDEITLLQRAQVIETLAASVGRTAGKLAALEVTCRELAEIEPSAKKGASDGEPEEC